MRSVLALALLAVAGGSTTAAAQPAMQPAAATPPLDAFLEQRAAEELAAEGMLLSRLGVQLDVEIVTGQVLVSLVDPATSRVVASTKLESLPAERDAAVAAVTVVAANLVDQLARTSPSASATAAAVQTVLQDERSHREAREHAEYRYRREAITFSNEVTGSGNHAHVGFRAYQGERPLDGEELLVALGRQDLADSVHWRKTAIRVGIFGGALGIIGGGGLLIHAAGMDDGDTKSTVKLAGGALMAAGVIGVGVGVYAMFSLPFGEGDLYDMADKHNAELRKKYGLEAASLRDSRKFDRTLVIAPYTTGDGGGLSVAGRF